MRMGDDTPGLGFAYEDLKAETARLRAELAELRASRRWEYIEALEDRAEKAEAAIARARELCEGWPSWREVTAAEVLRALDGVE